MKKKIKKFNIFSSVSFLPLMPLVAASCKKNDNDEKIQIINNESNPQTSKQMTPQFSWWSKQRWFKQCR
ncbi:variable surface lipoprotein [Mycoplasmopsis bovis]|nr:variable surface lipoprotein [Mycoplasmopsis bovis]MBT1404209.1 variable surface lipoprotein [Mycoplasmopsis bovis]MCA8862582.1 variable surface lipoprotein [Mycoplasmopsis bovis]QQH20990.1 variable surface lipoprotein [Mycoplasmopsis bovis]